jgi:hypothetical protein
MIHNLKSSKSIIARLYRNLGSNKELNESDIIEWVADALNMIGAYPQFKEVSTILTVENHNVKLPCGFVYLKDITFNGKPLMWSSKSAANNYNCPDCNTIPTCCSEYNFYIQDGCLNTNITEGELCIVYLSVPVDEEGFPLIPDDIYYDKALESYVTYMLDRIEFRGGRIPEAVYKESKQDWLFYVNSARGSAYMPDASKLEQLKNIWVRLIPKQNEYQNSFRNLETRERRNIR